MFVRNGQALGSVLHSAAPRAERPTSKKRGRPRKEVSPEPAQEPKQAASEESLVGAPDVFKRPSYSFERTHIETVQELAVKKEKSDGGDTPTA